ncbi:hypothetical protein ACFC18_49250, partial [Streptomyces sp. NPDC056121]
MGESTWTTWSPMLPRRMVGFREDVSEASILNSGEEPDELRICAGGWTAGSGPPAWRHAPMAPERFVHLLILISA